MSPITRDRPVQWQHPLLDELTVQLAQSENELSSPSDAAVLLALTNEPDPEIWLTRRRDDLRHHAGEVSLPGGRREAQDKDDIATALRESWEEIGLQPESVSILGLLPAQYSRTGQTVRPVVGVVPGGLILVPQESEVARIFSVRLADLIDTLPGRHRILFGRQPLELPAYFLNDEIIWGLTGRVIVNLLNLLNHHPDWPLFYPDLQLVAEA